VRKPRRGAAQGSAEQNHSRRYGLSDQSVGSGFGLAKPGPQGVAQGCATQDQKHASEWVTGMDSRFNMPA